MHISVMLDEIIKFAQQIQAKNIIDLTYGGGGHSNALAAIGAKVIAFDISPNVSSNRIKIHTANFKDFHNYVEKNKFDLIIADLGISTMQLEQGGFSYKYDSPLDFRMGTNGKPFWQILKYLPTCKVAEIIKNFGEEPQARKIAFNIERYKLKQDITTTLELRAAIGIDNYKVLGRVFQAFRIYTNDELNSLSEMLPHALQLAKNVAIISFHSLEDRIVKHSFKASGRCNKLILPSAEEIIQNPKSSSAKLRVCFET